MVTPRDLDRREAVVVLDNVGKRYGSTQALDDVSVALRTGITGLVGVNGAGKSTLLTALAGALRPDEGRILVGGDDVYDRRTRRRALPRCAFVPQLPVFPKSLTAHEVVTYLAWMRGASSRVAAARADEALAQVDLAHRRDVKIGKLSGGMQRRVAIAQALASRADLLLLDEPSTGLDPRQRRSMVDLLKVLPGTVLISSHVMEDVADLAERVLVLHAGTLRFDGDLADLRDAAPEGTPEHRMLEAGFLALIDSDH